MKITRDDLDKNNFYKHNSIDTDEEIIAEENLGTVKIKFSVKSKKYIWFKAGSGIEAGDGIEAGWGIKAGSGIEAGSGIKAGSGIITLFGNIIAKFISGLRICVGFHQKEDCYIEAEIRKGTVILGKVKQKEVKEVKDVSA